MDSRDRRRMRQAQAESFIAAWMIALVVGGVVGRIGEPEWVILAAIAGFGIGAIIWYWEA